MKLTQRYIKTMKDAVPPIKHILTHLILIQIVNYVLLNDKCDFDPEGVVQRGHPPSRPRRHRLGGGGSAQRGGPVISWPWRPSVGFAVGRKPAGSNWPQPGQPNWSAFIVAHKYSLNMSTISLNIVLQLYYHWVFLWSCKYNDYTGTFTIIWLLSKIAVQFRCWDLFVSCYNIMSDV